MRRTWVAGTIAAVGMGGVLMVINANDHARDPSTDTADQVATLATLAGFVIWLVLRWLDTTKTTIQVIRAIAAGVAIGAVVTGLASVVYDPWAD